MKALLYDAYGGPDVLHLAECPTPELGPADVLVRVHAATVAVGDCKARRGLLSHSAALPKSPGRYGSGEIAAVGAQVRISGIGDGVVFATLHSEGGSAAEYVRIAADKVARKSCMLSHVETASLIQGGTCAYVCLIEAGAVAAGMKVLVQGAAGSVGSACVELARHLGATVTAVCREADRDYVRALGAAHVVAFDREDFSVVVRDQDVVVDLLGGEVHRKSYDVLKHGGRLVYLNADPIENWSADTGVSAINAKIDNRAFVLDAVCRLAEQGVFTPKVGKVMALADGAAAHRLVEAGVLKRGRVILQVA